MRNRIILVVVSPLLLIALLFSGCTKNEPQQHEQTYDEMVAERLRNQPVPPIDPSICKDNPEGYVYFQVGEEIFRYTKDSPIQLGSVFSMKQRGISSNAGNTHIPEGCKGNPYKNVPLDFDFKEGEKLIGEFRLERFGLASVAPEHYGKISPGQDLLEARFNQVKSTYNTCDVELKNLTRCIIAGEDTMYLNGRRSSFYMADKAIHTTELGRSFLFNCKSYVGKVLCESDYRLYPTVDLYYALFPSLLHEEGILLFDQYIRSLIEKMRVKN